MHITFTGKNRAGPPIPPTAAAPSTGGTAVTVDPRGPPAYNNGIIGIIPIFVVTSVAVLIFGMMIFIGRMKKRKR